LLVEVEAGQTQIKTHALLLLLVVLEVEELAQQALMVME